jgi:glutamine amidotransferase
MTNNFDTAIINSGLGNLFSVEQACLAVGLKPLITDNPDDIKKAKALILPGVGAFGLAMESLHKKGLINPIKESINSGKPFLGICLGMQLLFTTSKEFGDHKGLNIIEGEVLPFPKLDNNGAKVRVPLISWRKNILEKNKNEFMYFVHSYYCVPKNKKLVRSVSTYAGIEYCTSIADKNITAVQYHPEKSGDLGIKFYAEWAKGVTK